MLRTFIRKRPGYVSVMAIITAVFLFIIGIGLLTLGFGRRLYSIRSNQQIAARCAADYGLTKAVYEMNKLLPNVTSPLPAEAGVQISGTDSKYSYTVTGSTGNYTVRASGTSGSITKTVQCNLRLKSAFEYAVLTKNNLDIGSVSTVNCDNCGDIPLKIGTTNNPNINAQITLKPNSTVDGDIVLGQGGIPELVIGPGATYNNIYAVATDYDLPMPDAPTGLSNKSELKLQGVSQNKTLTASDSGIYPNITLQQDVILTVDGDVTLYVTGNISLGTHGADDSSHIEINTANPNAKLTIYLGGSFESKNGAAFNDVGDPNKLTLYGLASNSINIKNSGNFAGTIYAPNATVNIGNSAVVYGSVIANNYTQDNSAVFTYDANLRKVTESDKLVRFVPTHWKEL
jgi:hypothetical protein